MSKQRGVTSRCAFWQFGRVGAILLHVGKTVVGLNPQHDNTVVSASGRETQEAMSYRGATLGLIAVMVFLVLFCYYGGAELWVMFAFFGYLLHDFDRYHPDARRTWYACA